jgi:hypothetical protein
MLKAWSPSGRGDGNFKKCGLCREPKDWTLTRAFCREKANGEGNVLSASKGSHVASKTLTPLEDDTIGKGSQCPFHEALKITPEEY